MAHLELMRPSRVSPLTQLRFLALLGCQMQPKGYNHPLGVKCQHQKGWSTCRILRICSHFVRSPNRFSLSALATYVGDIILMFRYLQINRLDDPYLYCDARPCTFMFRSLMYLLTRQSYSLTSGLLVVSKAFQVLSDANLRAAFDSHGGDPESRNPAPFRSGGGGGGMRFQNEVSPEELFNMFFSGGFPGGGVQFGGPNGTFFSPVHQRFRPPTHPTRQCPCSIP